MITLPQSPNVPPKDLGRGAILISGPKKIGKTSLASAFPNSFTLEFEPGNALYLPIRFLDIATLQDLDNCLTLLENSPSYCSTLVIDDVPSLAKLTLTRVCKLQGIEHPSDAGYGKAWQMVENELENYIKRFQALPMGKIHTAHTVFNEVETRTGKKFQRLEADMSKACNRIMDKYIQLWTVMEYNDSGERVLIIQGDDLIKAGNNLPGFKNVTGPIPLGKSPQEGYANLMKAWEGQLVATGKVDMSKMSTTEVKKKFVIKKKG